MRRVVIFFVLVLALPYSSWSQSHYFGMQMGLNISDYNPIENDVLKTKGLESFAYGLTYEFGFKNGLTINSGLGFIQKGFIGYGQFETYYSVPVDPNSSIENVYKYLALPVSIGYKFGRDIKMTVALGANTGYKIQSYTKIPYEAFGSRSGVDLVLETTETDLPIDISLMGILGAEYKLLSQVYLTFNVNYQKGLVEEFFYEVGSTSGGFHHKSVGFNLGLKVALGNSINNFQ